MTLLAAPVTAAPAQRISDTESVLFCEGITNDEGSVFAFAIESEMFGSFGDLAFWAAPSSPETSDPTWVSVSGSAEFEGTSVTARFDLVEYEFQPNPEDPPFGDPVGTATLEATLTAIGDPQAYNVDERNGNQVFRREGVVQEFSVEGTLDLPEDISFDLSSCGAVRDTFTAFSNSPASSIFRSSQFTLDCFWEVDGAFVSLFGFADEFGTFSGLFVSGPEIELFAAPTAPVTLTTEAYEASFDLFDALDPAAVDPVGSADASATLTPAGRINERFSFDNVKIHITGQSYDVDGTLSLTTPDATYELPMDSESCFAADQRVTEHVSPRQGPKGKPLPNDGPDGALPLAIGDSVTVRTGGTALEPEAPCIGEFEGQEVEFPIGKTAWWTFEGTGGDVTVDTAGSDFDTVLGVYTDDGGGLVPIGCVDDVEESLQARITVGTEAGVTYYLQAGGFAGQAGTLVLSLN
ncbi:MAG: hypothetical protein ACRDGB_10165 [Candidatus Limnocylindria bacterium]